MSEQEIEVRCCCQPQKLLGWLPRPPNVRVGTAFIFRVAEPYDRTLKGYDDPKTFRTTSVYLPVALFEPGGGAEPYPALKSEETPLETLRQIRGFRENTEA